MRRREVMAGLAGAAALPLAARAQQVMPVIGVLGTAVPQQWTARLRAFREGLRELGYVEGRASGVVAGGITADAVLQRLASWVVGQGPRPRSARSALVSRRTFSSLEQCR